MDPTKLIIEHPFSIEEKFKKADLEKMMATKDAFCASSMNFVYKESGANYVILCSKSPDVPDAKIGIGLNVNLGTVKEMKAKYRVSLPSIDFSDDIEYVFNHTDKVTGRGPGFSEKQYFQPEFFVNDELHVKIDGTLIFERPLISTCSFPINIRWNVKESELMAKTRTYGFLKSPQFKVSPNSLSKYYLVIYPNGFNDETRGKVVTHLRVELGKEEKIDAYTTFSSGKLSVNNYNFFEKNLSGGPMICSTDDLFLPSNGFLVNGEMTLKLEANLNIKKEEPLFKLSGVSTKVLKKEKDFKLIVDGKKIWVHKSLLIENSQYFLWTLNSKSVSSVRRIFSTKNKMVISGFSFQTVDAAVKLLYGLSPTFSLPDLIPLLYFSDKYTLTDIKALVENHLAKNILESNVCQLIHFSTIFHAPKLHQKSLQFLLQCLRKSSPVNDLDLLDRDVCLQLLSKSFCQTCD